MKKQLVSILLVSGLAISLITSPSASAQENKQTSKEIIYQAKEIKDQKELYDRALRGVQDVEVTELELPEYKLTNDQTGEGVELSQYVTSQLISEEKIGDVEVQEFAVTTFVVAEPSENSNNPITITPYGSISDYKWDTSISVKAYSTVNYSKTTKSGIDYAKVTSASGGWTISDSSVSLSNRKVAIGSSGWPSTTQVIDNYPTTNTWSYTAPSSWNYISLAAGHAIGATSTVTLKRGTSSTWTLQFVNNM